MKQSVKEGLLVTVIGGVVVAAILALWDDALVYAQRVVATLWDFLWQPIGIPLWAVALVVLAGLVLLGKWGSRRSAALVGRPAVTADPEPLNIEENHWAVLTALVRADGSPLALDSLRDRTGIGQLRLTAVLDELAEQGLITSKHDLVWGPQAVLTRRGRDLMIEMGLV